MYRVVDDESGPIELLSSMACLPERARLDIVLRRYAFTVGRECVYPRYRYLFVFRNSDVLAR